MQTHRQVQRIKTARSRINLSNVKIKLLNILSFSLSFLLSISRIVNFSPQLSRSAVVLVIAEKLEVIGPISPSPRPKRIKHPANCFCPRDRERKKEIEGNDSLPRAMTENSSSQRIKRAARSFHFVIETACLGRFSA